MAGLVHALAAAPASLVLGRPCGPFVVVMDALPLRVFECHAVDASRLAVGGFSGSRSYALWPGLDQAGFFTHLIALSPGFAAPVAPRGQPKISVSHGTGDRVLPISHCSRRVATMLWGHEVDQREFEGGHDIPEEIARAATDKLVNEFTVRPPTSA